MAKNDPKPEVEKTPLPIVSIEDEVVQPVDAETGEPLPGVQFWFGEKGVLSFADGSSYHVTENRAFITDPAAIENIREKATDKSYKIIEEKLS